MNQIYILQGEKVGIKFAEKEDAKQYSYWLNDRTNREMLCFPSLSSSVIQEEEYIVRNQLYTFTIFDLESNQAIGYESIYSLDSIHQTCEIGILIGTPEYRRQGYAKEALLLLLEFVFSSLAINNILIRIREDNIAGQKLALQVGFKYIGRRRQALYVARCRYDDFLFDLTYEDYCTGE